MICLKNLLGVLDVLMLLAHLIPRHLKHRLDVRADHAVLSLAPHRIPESADLLGKLLLYFLRCRKSVCLLLEFICVGQRIVISQLFPDQLRLLTQDVFSLVLIHTFFDLRTDLFLDIDDLYLIHQLKSKKLISAHHIRLFQKLLRILARERYVGRDHINQTLDIVDPLGLGGQFFGKLRVLRHVFLENVFKPPYHPLPLIPAHMPVRIVRLPQERRRLLCFIKRNVCIRHHRYMCAQIRIFKFYRINAGPGLSCDQYPAHLSRQLDDLPDGRDTADPVHILYSRILHLAVLLCRKEYLLLTFHNLLDRLDRLRTADIKVTYHLRQYRDPS